MVETSCKKYKNKEKLYPTATHKHIISSQAQLKSKAWVILTKLGQSYSYRNCKAKFTLLGYTIAYNVVSSYIHYVVKVLLTAH